MNLIKRTSLTFLLAGIYAISGAQVTNPAFIEEEVSFKSNDAVYSGTLALPSEPGKHPLVILVSGMGPQDRDWSFAGGKYKMAKIISDHLAGSGIAVYRYDDRGFGKSTGTAEGLISFEDLAKDLENATVLFRSRPDIGKIGLCGHSLGGILSVMAGAQYKNVDFIITLSGAFRNGADIMREQAQTLKRWRTSAVMTDEEVVAQGIRFTNCLVSYAANKQSDDTIKQILTNLINFQINKLTPEKMAENLKTFGTRENLFKQSYDEAYSFYTSPHQKSFVTYNAADDIAGIQCPLLVLFGEKDKNVVVESNLPPVAQGLAISKITDFTMKIIPGADHGYSSRELYTKGQMSEGVLEFMTNWIQTRTRDN